MSHWAGTARLFDRLSLCNAVVLAGPRRLRIPSEPYQGETAQPLRIMDVDALTLQPQPLGNALWLASVPGAARALVVSGPTGVLRDAVEGRFERVDALSWAELGTDGVPSSAGVFDLVALELPSVSDNAIPEGASRARIATVLHEMHRVLGDRGCLMIVGENPFWFRHLPHVIRDLLTVSPRSNVGVMHTRRWFNGFREAGFEGPRAFFLSPSYQMAHDIIPATPHLVALHERASDKSGRAAIRRLLARAGLHGVLHPGRLLVATK